MGDEMHEASHDNDDQHDDNDNDDNGANNDDLIHDNNGGNNYNKYHVAYYEYDDANNVYPSLDRHCTDDDCPDEHYYILTTRDLAARDNDQYDAGFNAGHQYATEHAANVGWPAIDAYLARNWSEYRGVDDPARGAVHGSGSRSDDHRPQDHVTWAEMERTIAAHFDAWENELDSGVAISVRDGCTGGLLVTVGISLVMWAGLIAGTVSLWRWIS